MAGKALRSIVDGHVHVLTMAEARSFPALMEAAGAGQAGLACQSDVGAVNNNPPGFFLKARAPGRFFLLAGLDHSGLILGVEGAPSLASQAPRLKELGADGIKLLAGKPTSRRSLGVPMDGDYFRAFFSACEQLDLPILWHVADPEEFWNPAELPCWARDQGWGYDSSFPAKEDLYRETENVLRRHPSLRVVLPHFYFLSADLDRAERLLETFPQVHLDLAPGIELYYNLSRQGDRAREFFCRFSDRILFGTDIWSGLTAAEAVARAGIVSRFLTSRETFRVPIEADFLLGPPEDGVIRGLDLPPDAASAILRENFHGIFGSSPAPLDRKAAAIECRRLARVEASLRTCPEGETEGSAAAAELDGLGA